MESLEELSGISTSCGGLRALEHENTGGGIQFHGELALLDDTYLVGKLKAKPPSIEYLNS